MTTMIQGPRYRVTKRSKNGEFRAGDVVSLDEQDGILNATARGWIDAADVVSATRGWAIELDREWLAKRRASLEADIAQIAQWEAMA